MQPIAYCEIDTYCQGVLLSRQATGDIPRAPIWDDVRSLRGSDLPQKPDIICGGFPCQDISTAGRRAGLEGERSGLFFEIMRLVDEIRPGFIFLENVPGITSKGLERVTGEITARGYDCRWEIISAAEVGAPHIRARWWLLAYTSCNGRRQLHKGEPQCIGRSGRSTNAINNGAQYVMAYSESAGLQRTIRQRVVREGGAKGDLRCDWWTIEPDVGRVVHGLPHRVDRIRGLGNAVVPQCAKAAFKQLMGISGKN